jgi:hypothetical protein
MIASMIAKPGAKLGPYDVRAASEYSSLENCRTLRSACSSEGRLRHKNEKGAVFSLRPFAKRRRLEVESRARVYRRRVSFSIVRRWSIKEA